MILWVFIKFFGVKIVITDIYRYFTDIYRYLPIFYRYFTDILPIFFQKIPAQAHVLHSRDFSVEKSVFSDFSAKNRRFYRFFPDFSSDFSSRCRPKTNFSAKYRPKKLIFCSLPVGTTKLILIFRILYLCYRVYPCLTDLILVLQN